MEYYLHGSIDEEDRYETMLNRMATYKEDLAKAVRLSIDTFKPKIMSLSLCTIVLECCSLAKRSIISHKTKISREILSR